MDRQRIRSRYGDSWPSGTFPGSVIRISSGICGIQEWRIHAVVSIITVSTARGPGAAARTAKRATGGGRSLIGATT